MIHRIFAYLDVLQFLTFGYRVHLFVKLLEEVTSRWSLLALLFDFFLCLFGTRCLGLPLFSESHDLLLVLFA